MALRHLLAAGTMALAIAGFAPAADAQPQFAAITDEFLPGAHTIFFDDFSDMLAGSAPARFRVRGANFTWEAEVQLTVPAGIARVYLIMFAASAKPWSECSAPAPTRPTCTSPGRCRATRRWDARPCG